MIPIIPDSANQTAGNIPVKCIGKLRSITENHPTHKTGPSTVFLINQNFTNLKEI